MPRKNIAIPPTPAKFEDAVKAFLAVKPPKKRKKGKKPKNASGNQGQQK